MLKIIYRELEGRLGLDIAELDAKATVADLFIPLQSAADDPDLPKSDNPARLVACAGCRNNCCRRYRIQPDLIAIHNLQAKMLLNLFELSRQYLDCNGTDAAILFRGRRCPFLSGELCSIYEIRPAFCRFYLCVPRSERLQKLCGSVLVSAEHALWDFLATQGVISGKTQRSRIIFPRKAINPWQAAQAYEQITLQSCCDELLWEWLQQPYTDADLLTYEAWSRYSVKE